jgi:protein-disulfide isomerase
MPWSPKSIQAAEASLCAGEQGKFWEYHELLFDYQKQWSMSSAVEDSFIRYAKMLGLNKERFKDCLSTRRMEDRVKLDKSYGKSLNINTTPTIFINNIRVVGNEPVKKYELIIEEELRRKGK